MVLDTPTSSIVQIAYSGNLGSNVFADLYEHVRQETGRGVTPSQRATPEQPSSQQPSSPAIAAVPAARPYQEPYSASNSPAPGPSYQDFESESEGSVSNTPGKLHTSALPHTASLFCNIYLLVSEHVQFLRIITYTVFCETSFVKERTTFLDYTHAFAALTDSSGTSGCSGSAAHSSTERASPKCPYTAGPCGFWGAVCRQTDRGVQPQAGAL